MTVSNQKSPQPHRPMDAVAGPMTGQDRPQRRSRRHGRSAVVAVTMAVFVLAGLATPVGAQEHVVSSGESLSVIARDYGVGTADLAAANGISNYHLIRVGQVLSVPGLTYEVKRGDSLSVIAVRTGVPVSAIVAANGISNPNLIRVGQTLRLTGGANRPTADPAAGYDALPGRLRANPGRLDLIPSFERWSAHYGVPTDLLMAMAYRESGWQNSVVSPKGAVGVGQLMPATSAWIADHLIGVDLDPNVADDNIRMSARFLDWLIGYMGSEEAAVAGYYQGPNSVRAIGYYDDTKAYVANIAQIRRLFARS